MRLNSDGTLDRSLGDEGALVLDGRPHRPEVGPVLGVHDGFVVPFALRSLFGETSVSARGAQPIQASAVPNPGSDAALGLLRQWDDGRPGRDPAPRPQPPSTTPAPAPTATTTTTPVEAKAESRSP